MKTVISALLFGLTIFATLPTSAESPAPVAAARQFGEAIDVEADVTGLGAAVLAYSADSGEQAISGRVGKVCQQKGCWMTLSDGDVMARVMTDYKFVLPSDLSGEVIVFGKLEAVDLDPKEIAHLAKDSGKLESEIESREYRIAARGVALRPASR